MVRSEAFDLVWDCTMIAVTAAGLLVVSGVMVGIVLLFRLFWETRFWTTRSFVPTGKAMSVQPILAAGESASSKPHQRTRRIAFLVLVTAFLGLTVVLAWGMNGNASAIPSALIEKGVPEFALLPVKGRTRGLTNADLSGEMSLVDVFASWCTAYREEHPVLMHLNAVGIVRVHGLNDTDQFDDAERYLDKVGYPYARTGADITDRTAVDRGVYGIPETHVTDSGGE